MRIHLDEDEIIQALTEFIETTGVPLTGRTVKVHLTAGRGANGQHKAEVEVLKPKTKVANEEPTDSGPDEEQPAILFGEEEG